MPRLLNRLRARWRVLWRSHQLETEIRDEMDFHIDMEAARAAGKARV